MNKIRTIISAALLMLSASAVAQDLQSGYFVDGYLYRHDMNPAIGNDQNYIAMPGLGNLNADLTGTLGLKDVLFNVKGQTSTFLNPAILAEDFLKNIKDKNKVGETLRLQILGAGFKGFGGYNTIEINARQDLSLVIPGQMLRSMKEGLTNDTYEFSDLDLAAKAYAEIAFGHSRDVNEQLRVGAKAKVLLGVGAADVNVRKATLSLGTDHYTAVVDAEMNVCLNDVTFENKVNENTGHRYVSGVDKAKLGVNGFGLAVDLGAEYKLNDDWRFSAAIVDLGFLKYSKSYQASTGGEKTIDTDKYIFNADDKASNNFTDEMHKLRDDFSALYELEDKGEQSGKSVSLGTTINVGAEYSYPLYRQLTFGFLGTVRTGRYSWVNGRLSINVAPSKVFSAGLNMACGTYGASVGWILNIHPTGFNLFMGMDKIIGSLSKQLIPIGSNSNFAMGINFPF